MRDIVRSKIEREFVRVKIPDGNAFWNKIRVNAGISKLMLLSLNLQLPVLVYAARHSLTAVRHKLMLLVITSYYWAGMNLVALWHLLSSVMLQKFNFSKYIFDNMMKNFEGGVKFLMYPREEGKGFSGKVTPLFQTMMVQAPEDMGEDSAALTDSHSTPIITQPSSSKPQKKNLQEKVLDLEKAKTAQAKEIACLKKRGRKIADLDADEEVTLIDETQERNDEEMLFDVQDDLRGEEVVAEKEVAEKEVSVADPITTAGEVVTTANIDELTLAQTLIEIKTPKPKAITTAATTTTTTRPKARGVAKDKGKAIMVEPKKYLKRRSNCIDEEVLEILEAQTTADGKKRRLQDKKKEEATIALIES
ncbi:hypothetical protein Tco_0774483 [Tanacetum coccineum]|uniref:Uncharacterized protein n=1 Tax=Tanacetum coccineum TaxID=301880 RepID=A0ABQ4ZPM2_9ASTR